MKKFLLLFLFPATLFAQKFTKTEIKRYQAQAKQVEIIRDQYGIPHVYGKTDADAVFGLLYAQCEDDFKRVEMNYVEKLGRLSEIKGEKEIYNDLLIRLLIDSTEAISDYQNAEPWMKKLLDAYADGINYYLYKNPNVKPALLTKFKPWYPYLWTDGSIGAISTADITVNELRNFYSGEQKIGTLVPKILDHQTGSNGFAIAPQNTLSGNAILYINPHTTFYFRPEVQVTSEEGLNAYGAVTWGQFFIYQGFNENCGWMHTSNNVDVADSYIEKISRKDGKLVYEYDGKLLPVTQKKISIKYKNGNQTAEKNIDAYFTQHGPIMAERDGKWVSLKSFNRSAKSLEQSWVRTKAKGLDDYIKAMDLKANTSNNTVFADSKGNIAYWHGNHIPVRDTKFNWSKPVDGSTSATAYKGLHSVEEGVHIYNPKNGWLQNCNSTPFTVAGIYSPKKENYPAYMAPDGDNFRGLNAVKVLSKEHQFTIDKTIETGYDRYLSAFDLLIPALLNAYQAKADAYPNLKEPIAVLKKWDYRSSASSVATTLAIEWAQKLSPDIQKVYVDQGEADQVEKTTAFVKTATPEKLLGTLNTILKDLESKFGKWEMPWGDVNRFQRLTGNIDEVYDDQKESIPVGFASALWGQLPSFNSRVMPGTNKRYGVSGNSFVCAVEFGPKIKAKSLLAGGVSGNANSPHFYDQAKAYTEGKFKDVLFYKEEILKNVKKRYHPGE
ncbi:penicillin acylase family protein [Pedobacter cryophilus]|uniref:Acylase n=1 Tax=Pedobacter cryophilus TaxID=2571271 RepID=A0A4U1C372_9SPHI|nr:penicillin acylase family protein [Pedobacter cryophilus]TKC00286.1 acylase [Pedobacter cryophilus]